MATSVSAPVSISVCASPTAWVPTIVKVIPLSSPAEVIVIRDTSITGTVVATFDVPAGSGTAGEDSVYQIDVPGNGLYCPNGAYAELTGGVDKVTIFYG